MLTCTLTSHVVACELCHGLGVRVVDAHAAVVHAVGKGANACGVPGDLKSHLREYFASVRVRWCVCVLLL